MSVLLPTRRRRSLAGAVAGVLAGAAAVTSALVAAPAHAAAPDGSVYELFLEPGTVTGNPTNAITTGKWGHEGPNRDQGTGISADLGQDSAGAAMLAAFGTDDFSKLAVAFTTTSADGTNERPTITDGENIGQAYPWFTDIGALTTIAGSNRTINDEVLKVSTLAEYTAWVNDNKPDQLIDTKDLVSRDPLRGNVVSVAPKGKSILNRWDAGSNISLVVVKTTGATDAKGLPIVDRGADGKAVAAWLTFTTALDPAIGDATHPNIATSGAYTVTSALTTPVVSLNNPTVGASTTLTATIKDENGATLPNASGTVQFSALPANTDSGTYAPVGEAVPVAADGTASLTINDLQPGNSRKYKATYTPDTAGATRYTSAESTPRTLTRAATATTTTLSVTGTRTAGATQTLSASVGTGSLANPSGSIKFFDGATELGTVVLAEGSVTATKAVKLRAGAHSLTARFVPTGTAYAASTSAAASVTIARAKATLAAKVSPTAVRAKSRPKLIVTVKATGLVPTGKVTAKVVAPGKKAVSVVGTLRNGTVTLTLPAAVKGTTKITVVYAGDASVLSATGAASYKAR